MNSESGAGRAGFGRTTGFTVSRAAFTDATCARAMESCRVARLSESCRWTVFRPRTDVSARIVESSTNALRCCVSVSKRAADDTRVTEIGTESAFVLSFIFSENCDASSGAPGSSGRSNRTRSVTESIGVTSRRLGPIVSCANM